MHAFAVSGLGWKIHFSWLHKQIFQTRNWNLFCQQPQKQCPEFPANNGRERGQFCFPCATTLCSLLTFLVNLVSRFQVRIRLRAKNEKLKKKLSLLPVVSNTTRSQKGNEATVNGRKQYWTKLTDKQLTTAFGWCESPLVMDGKFLEWRNGSSRRLRGALGDVWGITIIGVKAFRNLPIRIDYEY